MPGAVAGRICCSGVATAAFGSVQNLCGITSDCVSPLDQLVARGVTKAVGIANHAPPTDCACGIAETICVDIDPIFADGTRRVAVAIALSGYAVVADHTRRPTVAVAVRAYSFAADRTRRVAVPIAVNVYAVTADRTGRVARSICVKTTILGV